MIFDRSRYNRAGAGRVMVFCPEEQARRLAARIDDGRKIWKLSPLDLESHARRDDCTRARDDMFAATDTAWAPWFVAPSGDEQRARLNISSHLSGRIPYRATPREKIRLPKRKAPGGARGPAYPARLVPAKF